MEKSGTRVGMSFEANFCDPFDSTIKKYKAMKILTHTHTHT
jgi:hypothetical protein